MIKVILAFVFLFSIAQATTIESASFNRDTQVLQLVVTYQGGLKNHDYSLEWDSCQVHDHSREIAARLIDTGWDDTGTENFSRVVSFSLSNMTCKPAYLTLFSDLHSRVTIWVE